jgi:hypothetical protein
VKKLFIALVLLKNSFARADQSAYLDLIKESLSDENTKMEIPEREDIQKMMELYDSLDDEGRRKLFENMSKNYMSDEDSKLYFSSHVCTVCTDGPR